MGFLSPYMLWGALAAGIPVVLHLFFRSRYRTVPWAAMKFLLTSIEQTSRRLRFQELLLLVVRIMLLAVLALALARPTATSPGEILVLVAALFWNVLYVGVRVTRPVVSGKVDAGVWLSVNAALVAVFLLIYPWGEARTRGRGINVDAVFLFDTSYSMGAADGEVSRLTRAQAAAKQILDQLPPHSTVRILTCADRVLERIDEPVDGERAREIIDGLKLTHLATDLHPGVVEATELLRRCRAANKEFYLFSDMHKLGWDRQPSALAEAFRAVREEAPLNLVHCGTRNPRNVTIVSVTPQVDLPRPGERVPVNVRLRNSGAEPVKDLEVALFVDGDAERKEAQALPELGAGETRSVTLMAKLDKAGLRVVTAAIVHDDVPGDNRFDRVMLVRDKVNVLVVDGGPNTPRPYKSSSYYLVHALVLLRDGDQAKYTSQVVTPARAAPELLRDQDLCILVNVPLRPDVDGLQKTAVLVEQVLRDQTELRDRAGALTAERLAELEPEQTELGRKTANALKDPGGRAIAQALHSSARAMGKAAEQLSRRAAADATAAAEQAIQALGDAKQQLAQQTADMKKRLFNLARQNRLANTLPGEFVQALDHFVRQGHGLVVFPGDYMAGEPPGRKRGEPAVPLDPREAPFQDYNDQLWAKHGLLPGKITGLFDFPPPQSPLRFHRESLTLPAFRKFKDDDYYKETSKIDVYRALAVEDPPRAAPAGIEPDDDTDAVQTVMRFSRDARKDKEPDRSGDGTPALLIRRAGAGQVMLFATAADLGWKLGALDPTWTDWPLDRLYLPFLDVAFSQLVRNQAAVHGITCGQPLTWYPQGKQGGAYTLVHPDGGEERLGTPQPDKNTGKPVLTAGLLPRAGIYRLITTAPATDALAKEGIPIAVTPDIRESENLEALTAAEIDTRLGFKPNHLNAGSRLTALERDNREWTVWLLVVVLLLALGETALAWWCGYAK